MDPKRQLFKKNMIALPQESHTFRKEAFTFITQVNVATITIESVNIMAEDTKHPNGTERQNVTKTIKIKKG